MSRQTKVYIALSSAAGLLIVGLLIGSAWSDRKVAKLEQAAESAKRAADEIEQTAMKKELEAAEYKQKLDYLERQLAEIRSLATKQDEELKNLTSNTRSARVDVDRARRARAAAATAAELCNRLAQVGHPCD